MYVCIVFCVYCRYCVNLCIVRVMCNKKRFRLANEHYLFFLGATSQETNLIAESEQFSPLIGSFLIYIK